MLREEWKRWDGIHESSDQQKRFASAKKAENTPLSVDTNGGCGFFSGNHGRYETHLNGCNCGDFIRRKLPCKHMYRLAIELGVYGDKSTVNNDQSARKIPKNERNDLIISIISKIENYQDGEQQEIKGILLAVLYHKQKSVIFKDAGIIKNAINDGILVGTECYSYFIRKMLKRDMIKAIESAGDDLPNECKLVKDIASWMIARRSIYGPMLFPDCLEVKPSSDLSKVSLSVYKYLHRKYDEDAHLESFFNPETGDIEWVEKGFPNDFETSLLNLFDTNPLNK